jgi:DNA processing protein
MPAPEELRALLALRLVPGIGPRLLSALLERFGTAVASLAATPAQLETVPHLRGEVASRLAQAARDARVDAELALLARHKATVLAQGATGYPAPLTPLEGMPPLIYLRGNYLAADERAVGIVGSRDATNHGLRQAKRLAEGLARAGYTVISGLARGLDAAAHEGALEGGGRTLAVLANGLSSVYPPEHDRLAEAVIASGGLISEQTMSQKPQAGLFPARNRLISGLSRAVVVVEAREKSGALHTAVHGAEQGRPVLAMPGALDNPLAAGCHELIRKGAILCRGLDDVLEAVADMPAPKTRQGALFDETESAAASPPPVPPAEPVAPPTLDGPGQAVWNALAEGPLFVDELGSRTGLGPAELSRVLFQMELARAARKLPGNRVERR